MGFPPQSPVQIFSQASYPGVGTKVARTRLPDLGELSSVYSIVEENWDEQPTIRIALYLGNNSGNLRRLTNVTSRDEAAQNSSGVRIRPRQI